MSDLKIQGVVEMSSEGAENALGRIADKAGQMASKVQKSADQAGKAVDSIGDGAGKSADEFTRAEGRIVESIKRATTNLQLMGKTASQKLEFNIAAKGLDTQKFEPMLAKLREIEAQAASTSTAANRSLNTMGVSAAQTAAAMRGVPAQFTDIVVSLQSGQAPMTVLLQQGGQLKDMFGGVGNAAKALGGYVMGMVNPLTLTAATVGTLGYAFYQGSKEAESMAKAIILTGNAAGTSVNQLRDITSAVSATSGATKGAVNEALEAIINTGGVAAGSLGKVAEAALKMSKATGSSIDETVKLFSELGKDPVKASEKLNEQYNYLTAAVYKQIKALEDQGRVTEAAALAQNTFADAAKDMAARVEDNLGGLESAWRGVAGAAKSAWDKMLNVGREGSINEQIAVLKKQLATGSFDFALTEGDIQSQIAALEKKLATEAETTEQKAKQNEAEKAGIAWLKEGEKYLSKKQQMEMEVTKARNMGIAAGATELEINNRIAAVREKFKEKSGGKSQAVKDAEALAQVMDKLTGKDVGLDATYWKDLDTLFGAYKRGALDADKYATAVGTLTKNQKFNVDANKAAAQAADEYTKALWVADDALVKKAEALEREVQYYGLADSAIERVILTRLEEARAIAEANGAYPEHLAFLDREIEARKRIGSASSQKEFLDANKKAAEKSAKEWEKFSDDINRALTDALMRGFESGKSFGENFVDSLKNSLKTAALKIVVNYVTNGAGQLVGTVGNAAINGVLGTSSANDGAGTNYLGMASNANSLYNVANGNYLNTATGLYNDYIAGTTIGGYTAGYIGAGGSGITGSMFAGSNVLGTTSAGTLAGGGGSIGGGALGGGITSTGGTTGITGAVGGYGSAVATETGGAALTGSSSSSMGAYVWPLAAIVGMFMSSEAWKAGIKWNGEYSPGKNLKESGLHGAIHDGQYKSAEFFFGKDHADGQFFQTVTFAALSQQLSKMIWGDTKATGISSLKGAFVENGDGNSFVGQSGQEFRKAGGWFGSASTNVEWQNVGADFQDGMSDLYKGVRNYLLLAGAAFDDFSLADKIKGFVSLVDVKNANNIQGVQEAIANQLMQGLGELMFPSIGALQKTVTKNGMAVAESWSEIFGRVMQEVAATGNIFDLLGKNIFDVFGTGNADRVLLLSDNFVQLFGTIESMNERVGAYYTNFYSAQEKTDYAWKQMENAFAGIQQVMPTTRQGFRDLVDSLDLSTASGGAAFKALMDLQGAFAALTPEIESAAQSAAKLKEQLAAGLAGAQGTTDAAFAALERAVAAQKEKLTTEFEASKKTLETSITASQTSVSALASLFDTISGAVGSFIDKTDAQRIAERSLAQAGLNEAVAAANNGQSLAPFTASITGAIETLKQPSEDLYGSFEDYARAQGQANAALVALKNSSADQKSVQEMMLKALEDSLALQQSNYDQTVADLDAKVQGFKDQIDALRGIDNSVKTVEAAIKDLAAAIKGETAAKAAVNVNAGLVGGTTPSGDYLKDVVDYGQKYGSDAYYFGSTNDFTAKLEAWTLSAQALGVSLQEASGGQYSYFLEIQKQFDAGLHPTASGSGAYSDYTTSIADNIAAASGASSAAQIENLYSNLLGRASDAGGLASWQSQLDAGVMTIAAIAEAFKNSDEYKNSHATGLDRVPYNGYQATLHEGEAVIDAASVAAIQRYFKVSPQQAGNSNNADEIRLLREENRTHSVGIANQLLRFVNIVEKWDGIGMPSVREEA